VNLYNEDNKVTIITPRCKEAYKYNIEICQQLGLSLIRLKPEIVIWNENKRFHTTELDEKTYLISFLKLI
jgi:hypothetical protein